MNSEQRLLNSQEEIEHLNKRANLFLEFLISKSGNSPFIKEFNSTVTKLYRNKDLIGLRQINAEVDSWSRNLPTKKDSVEFWKILKTELGENYPTEYLKQIEMIKKKGIQNLQEYQLIEEHIGELCENDSVDIDTTELNVLLLDFEAK